MTSATVDILRSATGTTWAWVFDPFSPGERIARSVDAHHPLWAPRESVWLARCCGYRENRRAS
ncbi:MAG: hypothetical protein AAGE52_01480 [Myxococcota bacterium]